ncbi:MAG TPA: SRPBCC family protein [Chitinivibrionales bacterium]|jgi:activator of HSP90 ATPase|nr:SRPBCC family protein [Chitinivibrionales bacterium]
MKPSFTLTATFPVPPEKLFAAWLSSKEHSAFTGSPAKVSAKVGGKFTAWDGYISGTNVKLVKNNKIVQRWRTTEFSDTDQDSLVELSFEKVKAGTKLALIHSGIPKGQLQSYRQGWKDYYFAPIKEYFAKIEKA